VTALRITGHDTGSRATEFFGKGITSYAGVCVVARANVCSCARMLA
jgi:hypothetical protein